MDGNNQHPMPPGGPYSHYQQMQAGMQYYSPGVPQPPMASYPSQMPPMTAGQMHPAYQQPPQLPGAYPRSPSRMNPHRVANVQEWMDPHLSAYSSPVHSVAPSRMSAVTSYSDHSSMMSFNSMQYEMPMDEMRSPSQISSCAENIDPMSQAMSPMPMQSQAILQALPSYISKWKETFIQNNHIFLYHMHQMISEYLRQKKERDAAAKAYKTQLLPLIQLLPRMIELLNMFLGRGFPSPGQPEYAPFSLLCNCFCNLVIIFSDGEEDAVAREIAGSQKETKRIFIIAESLRRSQSPHLLHALDTILQWKRQVAVKAGFRAALRGNFSLLQSFVAQLSQPKQLVETWFQLGIISSLACDCDSIKKQLAEEGKDGLDIIKVLFTVVYPRIWNRFGQEDKPIVRSTCMKIFRQILTIVHYVLEDRDIRKERLNSREVYQRRVKVAIQLAQTRGLQVICDYCRCALHYPDQRNRNDVLLTKSGEILRICCDLLPRQPPEFIEFSSIVDHFRAIINHQEISVPLASKLKECLDAMILTNGLDPCKTHEAFAQSLYQVTNFTENVQVLFQNAQGIQVVVDWLTNLIAFTYNSEKWALVANSTLETEDTLLWMLCLVMNKMKAPIPEAFVTPAFAESHLKTFLNHLAALFSSEVLRKFNTAQWNLYKSVVIRLIQLIARFTRALAVYHSAPLLLTVVDNHERLHLDSISWLFQIMAYAYDILKTSQNVYTPRQASGLKEIALECFRTLKVIWKSVETSAIAVEVRNKMKQLIKNTYTTHIICWVCVLQNELTNDEKTTTQFQRKLLELLDFCNLVCVDEVAIHWSRQDLPVFRELSYNRDSHIHQLGDLICAKLENPAAAPLYEDVATAMGMEL